MSSPVETASSPDAGCGAARGSGAAPRSSPAPLAIGPHPLATPYLLAPLAGYTHLAFRLVVRNCGGVGWATTDLVQASHLVRGTKWARELVKTCPADRPLSVQIYGGVTEHLVAAARWLQREGYTAVDINMGCPMAKITGQGGGARLMCQADGARRLVGEVVAAVGIPVTVKMRLGWDRSQITAPDLARAFEALGVSAITIHGRTRQQGFSGTVHLPGIRAVVEAVERIPVIGNGDVCTVAEAWRMRRETGCAGVAIGRGALLDPWIFRRLQLAEPQFPSANEPAAVPDFHPTADQQLSFLDEHFRHMVAQHGEFQSCLQFRKFAAWYGARLGMPEDLEDRLRRIDSIPQFDTLLAELRRRHGERSNPRPTIEIRVPNGPVEYW